MNNILATINLSLYNSLDDLYEDLLVLKKDKFESNERILIQHTPGSLTLVNELLTFIDIPDYFVIFEEIDSTSALDFTFSSTHCIYPWANLQIGSGGEMTPCCRFEGAVSNTNHKVLTINNSTIHEVYHSDYMNSLRKKFLAGEKPVECSACWRDEASGIPSMRQGAKYKFKDIYYKLNYMQDDFQNLQIFDLKLGNACNLRCQICSPFSSSAIAEDHHTNGLMSTVEFSKLKKISKWAESEQFWDQMLPTVQNLKYLDLYGGEPLMNKLHFNFLKKLIDLDVAKNIKIDYNTNGTIFSEKFFDLWTHFKEIKLSFSIDDIADRFEAQRCGADWEKVCNNVKKYNDRRSNRFITELYATVNTQNILWLPELIEWYETQKFDFINFNLLNSPIEFNISSMSTENKLLAINKLKNYTNYPIVQSIVNLLSQ